jgi:SlyX protein
MSADKELATRLAELEAHVAHQDSVVDDLNDMTAKQWAIIDDLERRLSELKHRMEEIEESTHRSPSGDPLPPHH